MMKKFLSLFFAISLTLSACGTVSTQPTSPARTGTPTVTPTATQTPTSTITPLPTIPTFTPTFDVSTIVTVTPALAKTCPQSNPNLSLDSGTFYEHTEKYFDDQIFNFILEYINAGGSWSMLASEY